MAIDERITTLLHAATADMPVQLSPAPAAAIRTRIRRRRRAQVVAAAAAVVVLAAGAAVTQHLVGRPAPQRPVVPATPTETSTFGLPWASAFVARDDATITIYTAGEYCWDTLQPRARVTAEDTTWVTIGVSTRVMATTQCVTNGAAVPSTVTLSAPLRGRRVVDPAGGLAVVYFERPLPGLNADGWRPGPTSWPGGDPVWAQGYNGPDGLYLALSGRPVETVTAREPVATVDLGSKHVKITGGPAVWTGAWQVGDVLYAVRLDTAEGRSIPLERFEQLLAELTWS